MYASQFSLLQQRKFLPLFLTQFLGAFNDNMFKTALMVLITYHITQIGGFSKEVLVSIAGGVFILPFFIFSSLAGQIADKYEKSKLIRIVKFVEIFIMGLVFVGFMFNHVVFLLLVLFLMGTQSAFFGPLKYSLLPEQLKEDELVGANAIISSSTFIAIIIGTLFGAMFAFKTISFFLVVVAVLGWFASRYIPKSKIENKDLKININVFSETLKLLKYAKEKQGVFLSILGISWFWFFGATILTQMPVYTKEFLFGNENVASLLLITFSIGITAGSLLCNKLLKGHVHANFVPLGAFGMSLFCVDLFLATKGVQVASSLISVKEVFMDFARIRILLDLFLFAVFSGLFIVPLYAILQDLADKKFRARIMAANNILNAFFMVCSAIISALLLFIGVKIPGIFLLVALANIFVAIYISKLLPSAVIRSVTFMLLKLFYNLEVNGLENFKKHVIKL